MDGLENYSITAEQGSDPGTLLIVVQCDMCPWSYAAPQVIALRSVVGAVREHTARCVG